jgi:hypothetical protein
MMGKRTSESDVLLEYHWHHASWDKMLSTYLPELIGANCSLHQYKVDRSGDAFSVLLDIEGADSVVTVGYHDIPMPDERGVFTFEDAPMVFMPIAHESLTDVRCAGEQLRDYLTTRVTPVPGSVVTDASAVKAWLPLREWIMEFFQETAQRLDTKNFIAEGTHLRRIRLRPFGDFSRSEILQDHQIGLLCPIEIPTGPACGVVFTIASGAEIRDGAVVRKDGEASLDPVSLLSPTASYIPFCERNDPARFIIGANMIRQWLIPLVHEPALVRTGTESQVTEFWCGFNLLTAFATFGRLTYHNGIVVSKSAAARMLYTVPLAIGDKLSNRHGQAGVVSRILPDDEMPRLPDGQIVDLVVSFSGLHTNMNTGQLWEAVYSWLVAGGQCELIVRQFAAPSRDEISAALGSANLPEHGMVNLTLPGGAATDKPVIAGTVYWGRTSHTADDKYSVAGSDQPRQVQGEIEYWALRDNGAFSSVRESNCLTAEGTMALEQAVDAIQRGENPEMPEESTRLRTLTEKLKQAGITTCRNRDGLSFTFAETRHDDSVLEFPEPISHPWRSARALTEIPKNPESPLWPGLQRSALRLRSLLQSDAPEKLVESSRRMFTERLTQYYDELVVHTDFFLRYRQYFSGRGMIVPAVGIGPHQIGIPEEMAWVLFGPHVIARVGPVIARDRTQEARAALESVMSEQWIRVCCSPSANLTATLAFQPVAVSHRAIELHPLVCQWMNAGFGGLQIVVFHPLTDAAQRDAAQRLSVVGHLRRDPELVRTLVPTQDSLWGLAQLSRCKNGRSRIEEVLTRLPAMPEGYLTEKNLADFAVVLLGEIGPERILPVLETLFDLGLDAAMRTGGSLNPFMRIPDSVGSSRDEAIEAFEADNDFDDPGIGNQLLLIKSGARGSIEDLVMLCHSRAPDPGLPTHLPQSIPEHSRVTVASSSSAEDLPPKLTATGQLDGLSPQDLIQTVLGAGKYIRSLGREMANTGSRLRREKQPKGYGILSRAARAEHPGVVIASAAETGEIDALTDIDAMLFVGVLPNAISVGQ